MIVYLISISFTTLLFTFYICNKKDRIMHLSVTAIYWIMKQSKLPSCLSCLNILTEPFDTKWLGAYGFFPTPPSPQARGKQRWWECGYRAGLLNGSSKNTCNKKNQKFLISWFWVSIIVLLRIRLESSTQILILLVNYNPNYEKSLTNFPTQIAIPTILTTTTATATFMPQYPRT